MTTDTRKQLLRELKAGTIADHDKANLLEELTGILNCMEDSPTERVIELSNDMEEAMSTLRKLRREVGLDD